MTVIRTNWRAASAWIVALALMLLLAGPLVAEAAANPVIVHDGQIVGVRTGDGQTLAVTAGEYVRAAADTSWTERISDPNNFNAMYRWGPNLGSFHNKIGVTDIGALGENAVRGSITSNGASFMHILWVMASEITRLAIGFDPLNAAGAQIDKAFAGLANAVIKPAQGSVSLLVVGILVALIAALWGASRAGRMNGNPLKRIMGVVMLTAILVVSAAGASQSKHLEATDKYVPGVLSPGWVLTTTNKAITTVATGLNSAFNTDSIAPFSGASYLKADGNFVCDDVLAGLQEMHKDALKFSSVKHDGDPRITQGYSAVNTISGIWADIAIPAYTQAQFGNETNMGARTYCHLLESKSGSSAEERHRLLNYSYQAETGKWGITAPGTFAGKRKVDGEEVERQFIYDPINNREEDLLVVGWAVCQTNDGGATWVVAESSKPYINEPRASNGECQNWWDGKMADDSGDEAGASGGAYDVAENPKDDNLVNATSSAGLNFFNSLHGVNGAATASMGPMLSFIVGSLTATGVLITVAVGVALTKLFALFFLIGFVVVLVLGIFRADGWEKLGAAFAQMVGTQVVAAGAVILLSALLLFTRVVNAVGAGFFGTGSMMSLLWVGLSPLMAAVGINMIAKKLFKVPSPFSINGGMAFAAAGAGGLAGGLLGARAAGVGAGGGGAAGVLREGHAASREALGLADAARNYMPGRARRAGGRGNQGFDGGLRASRGSESKLDSMFSEAAGAIPGFTPSMPGTDAAAAGAAGAAGAAVGGAVKAASPLPHGAGSVAAVPGAAATEGVKGAIPNLSVTGLPHDPAMPLTRRQQDTNAKAFLRHATGKASLGERAARARDVWDNQTRRRWARGTVARLAANDDTIGKFQFATRKGELRYAETRGQVRRALAQADRNQSRMEALAKARGINLAGPDPNATGGEKIMYNHKLRQLQADAAARGKHRPADMKAIDRANRAERIGAARKQALAAPGRAVRGAANLAGNKHVRRGLGATAAIVATGGLAAVPVGAHLLSKGAVGGMRYAMGHGERQRRRIEFHRQAMAFETQDRGTARADNTDEREIGRASELGNTTPNTGGGNNDGGAGARRPTPTADTGAGAD